jgi:hypothetical protein
VDSQRSEREVQGDRVEALSKTRGASGESTRNKEALEQHEQETIGNVLYGCRTVSILRTTDKMGLTVQSATDSSLREQSNNRRRGREETITRVSKNCEMGIMYSKRYSSGLGGTQLTCKSSISMFRALDRIDVLNNLDSMGM